MKNGIAVAGNLLVDDVKMIDGFPAQGMLCNIERIERCVGGCAANTAVDLARMDRSLPVRVFGAVGDDDNGRYITGVLADEGIDIRGIKIKPSIPTSFTDVMTEKTQGLRTFFHARGANAHFGLEDLDFSSIEADFFHIGYALLLDQFDAPDGDYGTVMARALKQAREHGMQTSMDVVSENSSRFKSTITPALKYCDYLIINEIEASLITGLPVREGGALLQTHLESISRALLAEGVNRMVVIHAPEGACAMTSGGNFAFAPSLDLPPEYIKGTVGAGDAFCAGTLYSIYQGFSLARTLEIGAGAAACNLSALNSIDGMRDFNCIEEVIRNYARR